MQDIEIIKFKYKVSENATDCPFCGKKTFEDDFCFSCARETNAAKLQNQTFTNDIKEMRRVWQETQREVAARAGMPTNTIPRFESGKNHHSTRTVQRIINAVSESEDLTLRVAPRNIPLWAMLHDEGEYLFEIMAWKLDYIADKCEATQRVVDWERIVKETRRAAMVCRRLRLWDDFKPSNIGIFHGDKNWQKYQDYMYNAHLEYLFRLLKKARCWWW